MHRLAFCVLALALSGCALAQRMQAEEQAKKQAELNAQLVDQSKAAIAACNTQIPAGNPKTEVARTRCINEAFSIQLPTFGTDQDLAQAFMAERMAIAEQVQNGKMTVAQGDAATAEKWSQSVSESQNRHNATMTARARAVGAIAQVSAASAANTAAQASLMQASRPAVNPSVTCTHFPGSITTTCQ